MSKKITYISNKSYFYPNPNDNNQTIIVGNDGTKVYIDCSYVVFNTIFKNLDKLPGGFTKYSNAMKFIGGMSK